MDVVVAAIVRAVGVVSAYWKWLAGTGIFAALAWVNKRMVGHTARAIYRHMEEKNAAVRRRRGRAEEIIASELGRTTMRHGAHACSAACLNREHVLGVVGRLLVERAFKRLRDDGVVVIRGGGHYVTCTEPERV
jgi:hypothetical protein